MTNQALLLVAEDDPDDQYFFEQAAAVVCRKDIETHFVMDGAQLMRFLRERAEAYRRSLVVLDLNMRVKDGRKTLREIKADPVLAKLPVVVLTTSYNPDDVQYCKRYGADYYSKPDSIIELVNIVRDLCKNYLD